MSTARERREADLFCADLFGLRRPAPFAEDVPTRWKNRDGRVVFYDRNTLRFIEGWTRDAPPGETGHDRVFLIDRPDFDRIRADGRRRARELDEHIRRHLAGQRNVGIPLYLVDDRSHTVPLNPRSTDWDDLMIEMLIDAARRLDIESLAAQERMIDSLLAQARQDAAQAARAGAQGVSAREFVAFFALDNHATRTGGTLRMVPARNVQMRGNHAVIPLSTRTGTNTVFKVMPHDPHGPVVIGNLHTHVMVPSATARIRSGVSDVDESSARNDGIVVYAVDANHLHRATPGGRSTNEIKRPHNVLRAALKIFGGEP